MLLQYCYDPSVCLSVPDASSKRCILGLWLLRHTNMTTAWRAIGVSGVHRTNEVNARRARLVVGWVTVFGRVYHLGM